MLAAMRAASWMASEPFLESGDSFSGGIVGGGLGNSHSWNLI